MKTNVTIFFTAKPFAGEASVAQRNAMRTWTSLEPRPEILLMGDGEGYDDAAREFGIRRIEDVAVNERGLPLLNDMFIKAQKAATYRLCCYIDADVLLMSDFVGGIRLLDPLQRRFLALGSSWDISPDRLRMPDGRPGLAWEAEVRKAAVPPSRNARGIVGMDYFVFPSGALIDLPRFMEGAVGWESPGWDCRLVHLARSRGMIVIDATGAITAVHQNHGPTAPQAEAIGASAENPLELFSVADATHRLTPRGVRLANRPHNLWRRFYAALILDDRLKYFRPAVDRALRWSQPLRTKAGLTLSNVAGIRSKRKV